jgi:cyanophycin synthetase
VARAYEAARRHSPEIMVEQHIAGRDYRLTVFEGALVWAVERVPGGVTGDGSRSIAELVAATNADPRRGTGDHAALKRLVIDDEAQTLLVQDGLTAASVPAAGRFVRLRRAANIASGGMPVAVFDQVHPDNARLAVRAAAALRLDLAGVDLIIPDIARSWREGGAAICEVNAQPQLGGTTSANVYPQILKAMVPGTGRIPCVILAGFPEGNTLAQEVAARIEAQGLACGCHDAAGVRLSGEWLHQGPCGLLEAGQMLTGNRNCAAMVLTVAANETLPGGLPVAQFDLLASGPGSLDPGVAAMLQSGALAGIAAAADAQAIAAALLAER